MGNDGETTTTTTVRTETIPPAGSEAEQVPSAEHDDQGRSTSDTPHESLMESIRKFGGSQNLNKE